MVLERLFHRMKFVKTLPTKQRLELGRGMQYLAADAGREIFRQGDVGNHFYVILSGSVEVLIRDPHTNANNRVATLYTGDSFGELALLYSCPRAATVRATEECALWQLERRVYVNVKRSYQGACVAAAESVSRRFLFVLPCPSRLTSTLPTTSVRQSECSAASARSWSRASSSRRSGRRTRPRSRTRCGR